MGVPMREDAVLCGRCAVVVIVDPRVRCVFEAYLGWQAFVVSVGLVDHRIRARHRRPEHRSALDGGYREVEIGEARPAAGLGRGEVCRGESRTRWSEREIKEEREREEEIERLLA